MAAKETTAGERIAKLLARAGVCSRRDAEKLIAAGRVRVNGKTLDSPAFNATEADSIEVDGKPINKKETTRLWLYHKPRGLVTSHKDEKGRATIFQNLPPKMPRVVSVGRLDLTSEGLLLLTNDGALSRKFELPATGLAREYRVRALGRVSQDKLNRLSKGVTVDGVKYGPIEAVLQGSGGNANNWITMTLHEGKNREIRKVLEHLGLQVNRLIRTAYGPFGLGSLEPGAVEEVPQNVLKAYLQDM
jgi:23S rRNA pseudouridine2605 synthase